MFLRFLKSEKLNLNLRCILIFSLKIREKGVF
jgi:hypothetical protein